MTLKPYMKTGQSELVSPVNNNHSKTQAENCPDPSKILGTFSINAFVINIAVISLLFKFLIGGQLLYDVVLVSAIHQLSRPQACLCPQPPGTPIAPPSPLHASRLSQSPPCHRATSRYLPLPPATTI